MGSHFLEKMYLRKTCLFKYKKEFILGCSAMGSLFLEKNVSLQKMFIK